MTIGGIPPNFHKPWLSLIRGWHYIRYHQMILEGKSFTDFNCELDGTPIGPMFLASWMRPGPPENWKLSSNFSVGKLKAVKLYNSFAHISHNVCTYNPLYIYIYIYNYIHHYTSPKCMCMMLFHNVLNSSQPDQPVTCVRCCLVGLCMATEKGGVQVFGIRQGWILPSFT